MRFLIYLAGLALLTACASGPNSFNQRDLEQDRYFLTNRNRLPIDLAGVQKNLFEHEKLCHVKYTFRMEPNKSSYGYVYYQPEGTTGWRDRVLLTTVLLHDRSINVRAYSYYSGQMDRAHKMLTAIMKPESCEANTEWENSLDGNDDE